MLLIFKLLVLIMVFEIPRRRFVLMKKRFTIAFPTGNVKRES